MASPLSTATQNVEISGGEPPARAGGSGSPSARPAGEVIAVTNRDDFLLDLGEALGGQTSLIPVDSMAVALSQIAGSRRLTLLVIDSRDSSDLRNDIDRAISQAPASPIIVFSTAETEKLVLSQVKGTNIFAVLPIPLDRRKTAAIIEGALSDAAAKRAARGSTTGEYKVEVRQDPGFDANPPSISGPDEPPTPQVGKTTWIAIGIAVVAVAAGGFWLFTKTDVSTGPLTGGAPAPNTTTPGTSPTTGITTEGQPGEAQQVVEVPLVKGRADELLEKARLAMRERRYTEPANDSALLYYRSAQAVDPSSMEARDGMARVGNLLLTRFEEAMTAGRLEESTEALAALKAAAPADERLGALEVRLLQTQINKAFAEGNIDKATALVRQAQVTQTAQPTALPADLLAKWRTELTRRTDEVRVKRLSDLALDSIRDQRLIDPPNDNARDYLKQLKEIPAANASISRVTRELNAAYLRKARDAAVANRTGEPERWIAEARAGGASSAELANFQRDVAAARKNAASAETERLAGIVRDRIRSGALTDPAQDSAMYFLSELREADGGAAAANSLGREIATRLLDRAGTAAREGRTGQIDSDLLAARRLGADPAEIQAIQQITANASRRPANAPVRPTPVVTKLKRTRYQPPEYPQRAFEQRLSGSVTVEFVVDVNGEPRDAKVVEADPPEVFDRAALTAVKRWRYEPVVVNNVPTEIPTRMVIRFELPK